MVRTECWERIATLPVNRVMVNNANPAFCDVSGGKEDEALQKLTALIRDLERMLKLLELTSPGVFQIFQTVNQQCWPS